MTEFIFALSALFVTAGLLLLAANQLGFPTVPAYIVAGLLVGPFVARQDILELAIWGIAFLVFAFGTRIDLGDLRSVLRDGESAAAIQLLVVAPIAFLIGYGFGEFAGIDYPFRNALYFSAAATLSSTLVGREVLQAEIRNNLVHGRLASSIHLIDDIVAIGVILILSAELLSDLQLVTSKIGWGVILILAGLMSYRHLFPLLVRLAPDSEELVLMGCISILIAFMAAAEAVGISIVVGAFAAGLAIRSEGAQMLGVHNGIEAIKDFFAAIFFVTVGALVTVPSIEGLLLSLVLIAVVVIVNPFIHTLAFVWEGYDGRTGFLTGSSLNQVSELSLVLAIQAWMLGTIAPSVFEAIILAAAITMILSTITGTYDHVIYAATLESHLEGRSRYVDRHSEVSEGLSDHVVIVGYGRQGRRIVSRLEALEEPYVVIENDPVLEDDLLHDCENFVFGDAMASTTLSLARASSARLLISTVDHRPVSESILALETTADIILREDTSTGAKDLLDAGANFVAVPSVLAADQLVENLERILEDEDAIDTIVDEHREYLRSIELAGLERRIGGRTLESRRS